MARPSGFNVALCVAWNSPRRERWRPLSIVSQPITELVASGGTAGGLERSRTSEPRARRRSEARAGCEPEGRERQRAATPAGGGPQRWNMKRRPATSSSDVGDNTAQSDRRGRNEVTTTGRPGEGAHGGVPYRAGATTTSSHGESAASARTYHLGRTGERGRAPARSRTAAAPAIAVRTKREHSPRRGCSSRAASRTLTTARTATWRTGARSKTTSDAATGRAATVARGNAGACEPVERPRVSSPSSRPCRPGADGPRGSRVPVPG